MLPPKHGKKRKKTGEINVCIELHRHRQGGRNTGNVPPTEIEKNCCRKMMLFPKALFLERTFPKIVKNSIFYWIFIKDFQNFLKISQQFVFFFQTRENLTQGFEFLLKLDQNNAFLLFSKESFENLLKKFQNNCVFRPKRGNLTQGFFNFFEKSPKIIHFLQFS